MFYHRLLCLFFALVLAASADAQTPVYDGHGAGSVAPEVLAKYRPQPVSSQFSRRVQNLLDLRPPATLSFSLRGQPASLPSPDGRQLFFTWRVSGVEQVWRVDGPERFPMQMTAGEDRTQIAGITPDGKWLVLSRDRKGEEYPGLYLQSTAGGPLKVIQHLPRVQTLFGLVSRDSRHIYFVANEKAPNQYTVFRYDTVSGERTTVFDQPGLWRIADQAPDGKLLLVRLIDSQAREYFLLDPATGVTTALFGQGEREEYQAMFAPSAGEFFVLTPRFGDFRRLYRWRIGGKFEPLTPELRWDVADFSVDALRQRLYYSVNEGGYARVAVLDSRTLKTLKLPWPTGADQQLIGAATPNGRFVSVATSSAQSPQSTYVWDWRTKKLTRWLRAATPEENTARFAPVTLEHYQSRDGTAIPMFVRRPPNCGAPTVCPVLVHFHGGPEGQSRPGFNPMWQLFVDAGFIVVDPNVRGSEGYGKRWRDADNGAARLDVIGDIEDAASWIRQHWSQQGVAPKVGIFGGSYGGYSTLMGMTRFAGAYDAGVSVVGISNLLTFLRNTAPYRRSLRVSEYGDPDKDSEVLSKLSPITYIDRLRAPLMIVQGATDPRVPVGEAIQMYEAAKARGAPVELMIFPDEGHGVARRDNLVIQYGQMLRFFEQHLKAAP